MAQLLSPWQFAILLLRSGRRKNLVFELPMLGELPYLLPLARELAADEGLRVVLACHDLGELLQEGLEHVPDDLAERLFVVDHRWVDRFAPLVDMYLTSEQFHLGRPSIYSTCLFHGQPSKGITFNKEVLESFDSFFFFGPLHQEALERFLARSGQGTQRVPAISRIGYPKLDPLLNGDYDRGEVLRRLGLSPERKTILYAPAFNELATLRTIGPKLIEALVSLPDVNVIVKLAPDSIAKANNFYATGGVNWRTKLRAFEGERCRIADGLDANPFLAAADVMVTDVSGVAYDFLALGRPVIYYDCPDFYRDYVPRFAPFLSVEECLSDDTINAGRSFGTIVGSLEELRHAAHRLIIEPASASSTPPMPLERLLYNPGRATAAAAAAVRQLLSAGPKSRRPRRLLTRAWRATRNAARWALNGVNGLLARWGYQLVPSGLGYRDARSTVAAAQHAGQSVCAWLEGQETDGRKRGRRDRIIEKLAHAGAFSACRSVCEIGPGTGMYLEKVVELARPQTYDIYETAVGWRDYLMRTYDDRLALRPWAADGRTLRQTATGSCDLVHAHGVFVYLPILQSFEYLREASRVCRPGGWVIFDCMVERDLELPHTLNWLAGRWRFPSLIPKGLLLGFASECGLELAESFQEVFGESSASYFLFRKQGGTGQGVAPVNGDGQLT